MSLTFPSTKSPILLVQRPTLLAAPGCGSSTVATVISTFTIFFKAATFLIGAAPKATISIKTAYTATVAISSTSITNNTSITTCTSTTNGMSIVRTIPPPAMIKFQITVRIISRSKLFPPGHLLEDIIRGCAGRWLVRVGYSIEEAFQCLGWFQTLFTATAPGDGLFDPQPSAQTITLSQPRRWNQSS
ncbi:hypothetical protein L198_00178 [Cryptococcus wingfieldii CBS 7118]|uniref:Uncharacterized protein n=1 Tax=Cryptococcus wingfieldii CBS 7118 TaxID=1295528 RepID=A0A1E3K5J6_9TREE|nr:hypothetical protein L198_00178 [Cryptococcus wingfieldii CBS 7118]ODO08448.1 hypothetical protein L198_00178 [Cryptococcus wingfieldii CBS 7118]